MWCEDDSNRASEREEERGFSDFERGLPDGLRLSISETADLLGFSRTTNLGFTETGLKREDIQRSGSVV